MSKIDKPQPDELAAIFRRLYAVPGIYDDPEMRKLLDRLKESTRLPLRHARG